MLLGIGENLLYHYYQKAFAKYPNYVANFYKVIYKHSLSFYRSL